MLAASGKTVLISDYFEYYRLPAYLARYTDGKESASPWASACAIFSTRSTTRSSGGILESFGRLFKNDLRLYIYPLLDEVTSGREPGGGASCRPLRLPPRGCFVELDNINPEYLRIFSRDVLRKIRSGDASWETMVPPEVAAVI